eukprot:CAMPEP_0175091406 /NCGR_PEP_ID=MMETSP0086_2-20121207/1883_1 /TAXON_ID=136419 /ORGANISM="Unknown Unknown, Strain D1" /LENGTH=96 /DNA_ID=CAMNT_0016364141 /DNA_START=76 /DNA_END=366 /DNA_ORIENTATION=-
MANAFQLLAQFPFVDCIVQTMQKVFDTCKLQEVGNLIIPFDFAPGIDNHIRRLCFLPKTFNEFAVDATFFATSATVQDAMEVKANNSSASKWLQNK